MKHQYVEATTTRYLKWRKEQDSHDLPLKGILDWLKDAEDYANPLHAARCLVRHLRVRGELREVTCLCLRALDEYEEYQRLAGRLREALRFFETARARLERVAEPDAPAAGG